MKKQSKTEITLPLRIILMAPPSGVDFGIQEGKGNDYKTIQVQRSKDADLQFEIALPSKETDPMVRPTFLEPSCKDRQWDDLSTSTLENPLDR